MGLGLRIMDYRAALIGARLLLEGSDGAGLTVRVVLPRFETKENADHEHTAATTEI